MQILTNCTWRYSDFHKISPQIWSILIILTCRWDNTTIPCHDFFHDVIISWSWATMIQLSQRNHLFLCNPWGWCHRLCSNNGVTHTLPWGVTAGSGGTVRKLINVFVMSLMAHCSNTAPWLQICGNQDSREAIAFYCRILSFCITSSADETPREKIKLMTLFPEPNKWQWWQHASVNHGLNTQSLQIGIYINKRARMSN